MKFYADLEAAYADPSSTMIARAWMITSEPEAIKYFDSLPNDQKRAQFLLQTPEILNDLIELEKSYGVFGMPKLYLRAHKITEEKFIELGGLEPPKGPQLPPFL